MSETSFLTLPSPEYKASFLEALEEYHAEKRFLNWDATTIEADFPAFVASLRRREVEPAPGRSPEIILWLVEDITYIGRVNLRRHLTDDLRKLGGNIGYDIRPSLRLRGYGTLICRLALDEARRHGLERALLTCDEDNPASRKIIEANGGVLEGGDVVNRPGILCLRFWIDL